MTRGSPRRMRVVDGIDRLEASDGRLFVVVGVFDGLHKGHAYLLEHLRTEASRRRARPAVITFDHHPDEILTGAAPPLLLDPEERLERLEAAGVEVTVVEVFDVALRMTPFERWVRRIAKRVDLAGFLMTPDSAFGHDRGGTPHTVAALGHDLGYDVAVVPPFEVGGRPVRSADIRAAIARQDFTTAARLLGRPVSITGTARSAGASTRLDFALPVALPPTGAYRGLVDLGSGGAIGRTLVIDAGGPRLEPEVDVADGSRLQVAMETDSGNEVES
jgi:riboflavin kinase/FMN adenylyltransferase